MGTTHRYPQRACALRSTLVADGIRIAARADPSLSMVRSSPKHLQTTPTPIERAPNGLHLGKGGSIRSAVDSPTRARRPSWKTAKGTQTLANAWVWTSGTKLRGTLGHCAR